MSDPLIARPVDGTSNGCPVLTKLRSVIVDKGTTPALEWQMRDANGNPLDLSDYLCTPDEQSEDSEEQTGLCGQVIFRFADAVNPACIQQIVGETVDEATGTVKATLTCAITDKAGIWQFQIAITNRDGKIVAMNSGLLGVERGLFGDVTQRTGPPTLQEIRMEIRDSAIENLNIADFEFSDAEIIAAIAKPIRQWNERPPPLGRMTASNFPHTYNWTRAIVAELLSLAAYYYRRNKTQMSAAGITDQALDRDAGYEAKAAQLREEWLSFVDHTKVQMNADAFYGTHESGWY